MAKKTNYQKKSNVHVGKKSENNNQSAEEAKLMLDKGDTFGTTIVGMMSLFAYDYKGLGAAAIGMAKALAGLKDVAKHAGVNIDKLYDSELAYYENSFENTTDLDEI